MTSESIFGDADERDSTPNVTSKKSRSVLGLAALGVTAGSVIALVVGTAPFISPALRRYCLPFVPATDAQVKNVISVFPRKGKLVDIGSGDGRIVIEAAKHGFAATGYELNPWLVLYSKIRSYRLGLRSSASFTRKDLWKTGFKKYDSVVIFGVTEMMPKLEEKLCEELLPGSHVVACRFPFPNWQPIRTVGSGLDTVWLYNIPKSFPSRWHESEV